MNKQQTTSTSAIFTLLFTMAVCVSSMASVFASQQPMSSPQNTSSLNSYTYTAPVVSTKLPRATPESTGISSLYIMDLLNEFEKRNMEIHSVMIAVDGKVIFEGFYNPYTPDTPYIIHSLTKLFTNTAAGMAYTNGQLKLEDKVADFFPERLPPDASENLKAMTVKDLIEMRSGHAREISGNEWRTLKTSWLDAFMKEPVVYKPGEKYQYSSGNSYMLSAMVQKATGKTCEEVLQDSLLKKLGIKQFSWLKSPEGICSGGNGVMITTEDMLKVAQLYLQKGMWNGERILTEEWCDLALGIKDAHNDGQTKYAYHWWDREGFYTSHGVFGQVVAVVPQLNMTIAVTGGTDASIYRVLKEKLIDRTLADSNRNYDGKYASALKTKETLLNTLPLATATTSPLAEKINGKEFRMAANTDGISKIKLEFTKDSVNYIMTDERGTHTIQCGIGSWIAGNTTMTGNYLHHQYQNPRQMVVASAHWTDNNTLTMIWRYPEMAFCDYLTLTFTDTTLNMVRSVNINSKGPYGGLKRPEVIGQLR